MYILGTKGCLCVSCIAGETLLGTAPLGIASRFFGRFRLSRSLKERKIKIHIQTNLFIYLIMINRKMKELDIKCILRGILNINDLKMFRFIFYEYIFQSPLIKSNEAKTIICSIKYLNIKTIPGIQIFQSLRK